MQEARVVMVVNKDTKGVDVSEVLLVSLPSAGNVSHTLSVHPDVSDCEVHGIVEETGDVVLVGADVSIVSIEVLAHLEDASGLTELGPEILGHLWDGVNTDAVEVVCLHEILDPVLQLASHPGVALVEIGKACETAVLDLPLIVPIVDVAVSVIVLRSVEGGDLAVVVLDGCDVIADDVDHDPDAHVVSSVHEVLECLLPTEVIIDFLPVASPVPVISIVQVIDYR